MISVYSKTPDQRAGRPVRPARLVSGLALGLACALSIGAPPATAAAPVSTVSGQSIADFYAARAGRPLFLAPGNEPAVADLLQYLGSSRADGLNPKSFRIRDLQRAARAGSGDPQTMRSAEMLLAQAYVSYARDLRGRAQNVGVIYVDNQLKPTAASPRSLLEAAAVAPSLQGFVSAMGWMHPYYAPLRQTMIQTRDSRRQALIRVNLERVRLLPPATAGRYVMVNAAAQRLFMIEGGQSVDMMRVVVGKPVHPTPQMAALIRFTSLNPYWNVPSDLAAERIAPNVVKGGPAYLRAKGYQLLSDWSDKARVLAPSAVDWNAVVAGRTEVRLRQLPGPANSMGDMKFMFPNAQGIYLHDTPSTELFAEASRFLSGGCVRLEAAPRLASWLYGKPLKAKGARPEQRVNLAAPVPVYLTYLTVVPSGGGQVAVYDDIYGRDAQRMAQIDPRKGKRGLRPSR